MRKKFIVVTTIPASLRFFEGQLNFLNKTFEVMAISSDKKLRRSWAERGISVHCIPMQRPISLCKDIISFYRFIVFFLKSNPYIVHGNTPKAVSYQCFQQKLRMFLYVFIYVMDFVIRDMVD